ncbi:MAG: hypothetical protein HKUEN07_19780 [Rhodocyclaceae bacterium]|nr:MAG: hypothetical protein BroJett012_03330 [Betaproteobacteria bacterium]GJQ55409.1 MAG: hypothetical protein HKUEN07_19780 [Rhodocyclaceae bacterium]
MGKKIFGMLDAGILQPSQGIFAGWLWKIDGLATAQNGWQKSFFIISYQYKQCVCRWFFKYFKKCVGGCLVHGLGRLNHDDAQALAVGADTQEAIEVPYLIDADLIGFFLRHRGRFGIGVAVLRLVATRFYQPEIRMITRKEPVAGSASPTSLIDS